MSAPMETTTTATAATLTAEISAPAGPSAASKRIEELRQKFEALEEGAKQTQDQCKNLVNQSKALKKEILKILEKAEKKKEKKKVTHSPRTLSPEFVQFFGAASNQMTRAEAVKLISEWAKSHGLGRGNKVDVATSDKAKSLHQFLQLAANVEEIRYIDFQGMLNRFILDKPAEKPKAEGGKKRKAAASVDEAASESTKPAAEGAEPAKKKRVVKKKEAAAAEIQA